MGLNLSNDFIVPQPEIKKAIPNEATANEQAIYTIGLDGQSDFQDIFEMSENIKNGETAEFEAKKAENEDSEYNNYKSNVAEIIDDPQYDDDTKRRLIADYYQGIFEPTDQETRFIEQISTLPGGDTDISDTLQDEHLSLIPDSKALKDDIRESQEEGPAFNSIMDYINGSGEAENLFGPTIPKTKDGTINWKQWGKQTSGETTAFVNFFTQVFDMMGNLGARWALATKDKLENGEVDWATLADRAQSILEETDNPVIKAAKFATLEQYADKMGFGDEFRNSLTRGVEMKLSEGIEALAEFGVEKGVFSNKDQGMLITETALIATPMLKFKKKKGATQEHHKKQSLVEILDADQSVAQKVIRMSQEYYNQDRLQSIPDGSPLDNVNQANPKAGSELALTALVDETNTFANKLNTNKFQIIHDTLLNQADVFHPDVKNTPSLYNKLLAMTDEFSAMFTENYFNTLQNYEVRFKYANLINDIVDQNTGVLHLNKSRINIGQNNIFGKVRFGKNDSYMIYSRNDAIQIFNNVKKSILDQGAAKYGNLKNFDKNRGGLRIFIEDLDTGKTYTPESIMKETKFFNLEDFKKMKGKEVLDAADMAEFKKNLEGSERTLSVTMQFDRAFDPLDLYIYDVDSGYGPKTTYLGSKWLADLVDPRGDGGILYNNVLSLGAKFDDWLSQGYQRAAEKTLANTKNIIRKLTEIAKSDHASYVFETLEHMFQTGMRDISRSDLIKLHRPLFDQIEGNRRKQVIDKVYEDVQTVRLVNKLDEAYTNKLIKEELIRDGFKEALYGKGDIDNMVQPVRTEFPFNSKDVEFVWDFETKDIVELSFDMVRDGIPYDKYGRQIVQLRFPQRPVSKGSLLEDAKSFAKDRELNVVEYAVIDKSKYVIDSLPNKVMKSEAGYMPTIHKAQYFAEIEPIKIKVNGKLKEQPEVLARYREVVATANTKADAQAKAQKILDSLPKDNDGNPLYVVREPRRAENTYGDIKADQEIYRATASSAKSKGQYLRRGFKDNLVEDMMVALERSHRSLDRLNLLDPHLRAFEDYFVKVYPEFLKRDNQGKPIFPRSEADLVNQTVNPKKYKAAMDKFKYYESQQTFATKGEGNLTNFVNKLYDGLEGIVPNKAMVKANPILRKLDGQAIASAGNKVASTLFIALNSLSQLYVQTSQMAGWMIGNPHRALRDLSMSTLVNLRLLAESRYMKGKATGEMLKGMIDAFLVVTDIPGMKVMTPKEFNNYIKALEKSGLADSASLNMMVNELLGDRYSPINPTKTQRVMSAVTAPIRGGVAFARTIGFNFAEFQNRLFFANIAYMNARKLAKKSGKEVNMLDKRTADDVFYQGWRISGSQTRQGALNMQRGVGSGLFQFLSVIQKIGNVFFQNNATNLTKAQRARFLGGQGLAFGMTGGVYLGNLIMDYLEKQHPDNQLDPATKNLIKRGLMTHIMNNVFYQVFDQGQGRKPDLAYAERVSPVGEAGSPIALVEFAYSMAEMLIEGRGNLRLPLIEATKSIIESVKQFDFFLKTKEITKEEYSDILPRVIDFASAFRNVNKAYLQAESGEIITSYGNSLKLQKTHAELWAQGLAGIRTAEEVEWWEILRDESKRNKRNQDMATDIYKQMVKVFTNPEINNRMDNVEQVAAKMAVVGELLTVLEQGGKYFDKDDIMAIQNEIVNLDRRAARQDIQTSVLGRLFRKQETESTEFINQVISRLEGINKPYTDKAVEMLKMKFNIEQTDDKGVQ